MTRWIGKKLLGRMALLAGAVALVVVLLLPKEPPNRLPCYGWQAKEYYYSQGGVAVPVEGERARQTIRRFFQEARYDDLLDLYPSLGTGPDRITEIGQMHFDTYWVMRCGGAYYAVSLIQPERPQAKIWKAEEEDGRMQVAWQDFYQCEDPDAWGALRELEDEVRGQGFAALGR